MAHYQYRVAYLDGEDETVTANTIEPTGGQYTVYRDGKPVGYIPNANVRSILRQDDEAVTRPTPHGPQPAKNVSRSTYEQVAD